MALVGPPVTQTQLHVYTETTSNSCEFRAAHFIKELPDIVICRTFRGLWNGWNRTNPVHETKVQDPGAARQISRGRQCLWRDRGKVNQVCWRRKKISNSCPHFDGDFCCYRTAGIRRLLARDTWEIVCVRDGSEELYSASLAPQP